MKHYALADKGRENGIVAQIAVGDEPVNTRLYRVYAENLRKAVGRVYAEGGPEADRYKANLSRFAAYKAWHATQQVRERVREADGDTEAGTKVLHAFNRWQAAEYNTAVARCRTAKQWDGFAQDDNMRLFPNLRWLPSRSATPRELHAAFWNRVWAKDDPFWNHNQPGNLWNCKCDWEETDDPPTDGNPKATVKHDGLEGNPAKTGEIFTDNASYIRKAPQAVEHEALKLTRTDNYDWAKEHLKGKEVENEDSGLKIAMSGRGIKEYLNQNHDDYYVKNEMIRRMPQALKQAKFMGYSDHKGRVSLIFKILLNKRTNYLIVHDYSGKLYFHGITESDNVLTGIKKQLSDSYRGTTVHVGS